MRRVRFLPLLVGWLCCISVVAFAGPAPAATAPLREAPAAPLAGPTADQLRARVQACGTQLSNGLYAQDSGGSQTIPVCGKSSAVFWTADFDIDCDGQRTTQCNENTDPSFQPETAWPQSNGQPLNSATLPFIVVPLKSSKFDYSAHNITGGTVAAVVYQNKVAYAVVGDLGPTGIIGEGSYELAEQLGINPNPATGGVGGTVVSFILFPGVKASPIEDAAEARSFGETAANQFVAAGGACDDVSVDFTAYPQLQSGSTGNAVKASQCLLTAAGHSVTPSGTYDAATASAATAFQTARGLPANGVVDFHTWTALLARGDKPTLRNGSTGVAVRRLQRSLTAALKRTVGIDGQFGSITEQAVRDYQSSRSLGADGIVGNLTWTALQAGK